MLDGAVQYGELLVVLWDRMDPTTLNRQGNDMGTQYRSGYVSPSPSIPHTTGEGHGDQRVMGVCGCGQDLLHE